jgi:hypothetical protein
MAEAIVHVPEDVQPDAVCDGGNLDCGSGLLLLIRKAMNEVAPGGILENPQHRDQRPGGFAGLVPDDQKSLLGLAPYLS